VTVSKNRRLNGTVTQPAPLRKLGSALIAFLLLAAGTAAAGQVDVKHIEGLVRGFLVLRTLNGERIAGGDMNQFLRGGRVTNRLTFHFRDGSLHDETVVFTQRRKFRLVSYHLVQKGPSFPTPMEVSIDGGRVKVRYTDEDGKEKVESEKQQLPADVSNGMVLTLAKNISPGTPETVVSMLGTTPEPRLVKLKIVPLGTEPFSAGGVQHEAIHYLVSVEIGGLTGALAKLFDKEPPDSHVWIVRGESPGFVKAERPFYLGGPPWRIELASPDRSQSAGGQH
jgi:hypothetical protein